MIADDLFKSRKPLFEKLTGFGFVCHNETYTYTCPIADNQFHLNVLVDKNGQVRTQVMDADTGEAYTLHLTRHTAGSFVGKVRADYSAVLQAIADTCFEKQVFQSEYAAKITQYISEQYQNRLEYLWEKSPENAIVRRTDNRKWYAVFSRIEKNKIGLAGKEKTEIINLKMQPEDIVQRIDGKKYFSAWHMNKKHWITLCLDGSVDLQEIYRRIDESYRLARTGQHNGISSPNPPL